MKQLVFVLAFSLLAGYGMAQQPEYPVKVVDGRSYYEYTVRAGDGLFSIARSFGVKQRDLSDANEGLTADIRPGQVILVPMVENREDVVAHHRENDRVHVVEKKQTLYGISKMYKVSIDSLKKLNPFITRGLRAGDTLLISSVPFAEDTTVKEAEQKKTEQKKEGEEVRNETSGEVKKPAYHVIERKETLYGISKMYDMPIHEIIALNPGAEGRLRAGDTLMLRRVSAEERVMSEQTAAVQEKSEDVVMEESGNVQDVADVPVAAVEESVVTKAKGKKEELTVVYLLPFHTEQATVHKATLRFVEFYRGALVALDKAKEYGISTRVYTYDTGRTKEDIEAVLKHKEIADADVIIGPAYSDQIEPVLNYGRRHDKVVVVPFSGKIPERSFYPGLVQFNPPSEMLNSQAIASVAADRSQRYVIGRFASVDSRDKALADELRATLEAEGVQVMDTALNYETLKYVVDAVGSHPTTLLMASSAPADVNLMLDSLAAYQRNNIRVWGFEEWSTLVNKYPNTVYTSLFNAKESAEYAARYDEMFGGHVNVSEPRYDLIGYDLATLVTRSMVRMDTACAFQALPAEEYMQSVPLLIKMQNRYVNNRLIQFHWDGVMMTSKEYIELPKGYGETEDDE